MITNYIVHCVPSGEKQESRLVASDSQGRLPCCPPPTPATPFSGPASLSSLTYLSTLFLKAFLDCCLPFSTAIPTRTGLTSSGYPEC